MIYIFIIILTIFISFIFIKGLCVNVSKTSHINLNELVKYINNEMTDDEFDKFIKNNIKHLAVCHECLTHINLMWRLKEK